MIALRGEAVGFRPDRIRQTWADRSSDNCDSACPPAGLALAFLVACVPGYPASLRAKTASPAAAQRRRSSRICAAKTARAIYDLLSTGILQRSDHAGAREEASSSRRSISQGIRISKRFAHRRDDSTVEAVLRHRQKVPTADPGADEQGRLLGLETSLEDTRSRKVASILYPLSEGKLIECRRPALQLHADEISPQICSTAGRIWRNSPAAFSGFRGTVVARKAANSKLVSSPPVSANSPTTFRDP